MTISRRHLIQAVALTMAGVARPTFAQQFPTKPIRLIVPATAGTSVDLTARFVAERLGNRLNTSVIVDNRAGAGGGIGSDFVSKAPPDGYTLLLPGITLITTRLVADSPFTYDPVKDFTAIAKLNSAALAVVVSAESPYKTLADLVKAMKEKPGEITYASGGSGSTAHLCAIVLMDLTHTKAKHIPYKGNTPAVTDTAGGQVDFTCQGSAGVLPMIKAGKLRALAVTSRERWDSIPNVPTGIEAGVPDFIVSSWIGALGPAGIPAPIVQRLSEELVNIARSVEFKDFCEQQAMFVDVADHQKFSLELVDDMKKWQRIVAIANAT
ncbi:MAG: tripartite tricarboxylate transporter substrate binding protein [Burkholderiales bacterium]